MLVVIGIVFVMLVIGYVFLEIMNGDKPSVKQCRKYKLDGSLVNEESLYELLTEEDRILAREEEALVMSSRLMMQFKNINGMTEGKDERGKLKDAYYNLVLDIKKFEEHYNHEPVSDFMAQILMLIENLEKISMFMMYNKPSEKPDEFKQRTDYVSLDLINQYQQQIDRIASSIIRTFYAA